MRRLLIIIALILSFNGLKAQSISHIETTKAWYYIYDQNGKKVKTLSTTIGELQGFSSSFFIVKSGSCYYIYDATGKKTKTMSVSSTGRIMSVSGDTFTSQSGSWLYTWSKEVKEISTRAAIKRKVTRENNDKATISLFLWHMGLASSYPRFQVFGGWSDRELFLFL